MPAVAQPARQAGRRRLLAALAALPGAWLGPPAQALERGRSDAGAEWISGGIGASEREEMLAPPRRHRLWLTTAARRSGAYLSGAQVRIVDLAGRITVLAITMDGPWLLATLPDGRYEVQADWRPADDAPAQSVSGVTRLAGAATRRLVLYFDDPVESALPSPWRLPPIDRGRQLPKPR
jgi:hypothetical protein